MESSKKFRESNIINWLKTLHRRQGIFRGSLALNVISIFLKALGGFENEPEKRGEILLFIEGLLRQTLVFNPSDYELFKLIVKVHSLRCNVPFRTPWLASLQKCYRSFDGAATEEKGEYDYLSHYDRRDLEQLNPLVLLQKIITLWEYGDWQTLSTVEKKLENISYRSLLAPYIAWVCFRAGKYDGAEKWLSLGGSDYFLTFNLRAELALESGDVEKGVTYWVKSLMEEPYQPWILYRLYELSRLKPDRKVLEGKKIHILFYTFNKRDSLLNTINSVMNSYIGDAQIIVLNNGSTLFSPQQLEEDIRTVVHGRGVSFVHLPVNIGAPAARNWLWHIPKVRQSDYVAFLDDDILVPEDWLIAFVDDLESFPDMVVVGPMVFNPDLLLTPQWAYLYLIYTGDDKIKFTPIVPLPFDVGQYSVRRPCLCVMGCCHLFHMARCKNLKVPDFDIRFSPSQVDDLEHNLQTWKCGGGVLFDGRVKVVHLQVSGRQFVKSRADQAHITGNHVKMEAKFSSEDLMVIDDRVGKSDDDFWSVVLNRSAEFVPLRLIKNYVSPGVTGG